MYTPSSSPPSPLRSGSPAPEPSPEFTPMPLRARGVLETLDLTIKVFRRYFKVLLAWSALSIGVCAVVGLFGVMSAGRSVLQPAYGFPYSGMSATAMASLMLSSLGASALAFFCYPLMVGASACCVAGAVRGQSIKFAQCWSFSRPRYWSMLGQTLLAIIVLWIVAIGFAIVFGVIIALGAFVISNLPGFVAGFLGIIGVIALYAAFFVVMMLAAMWMVLVPVVVCMEENNRNSSALGRAMSLLRGNWRRAAGLMLLVWIGFIIVGVIFQAPLALLGGSAGSTGGLLLGGAFLMQMLFWLAAMPFYTLLISLFYIDARVRNEALDLEWSSHVGTPQGTPDGTMNEAMNTAASNGQPNFYPPVAQTTSVADDANITRADTSVWSASPEDLASMPLETFTPQRVAPIDTPTTQTPAAHGSDTAQAQPMQTGEASFPSSFATPINGVPTEPPQPQSSTRLQDESAPAATSVTSFAFDNSAASVAPSSVASSYDSLPSDMAGTQATVKCPQCGAEVAASQTFCMNCGHRLARRDDAMGFGA